MSTLDEIIARMGAKPTGQSFGMMYGRSGSGKSYLATRLLDKIVEPGKAILHIDTSKSYYRLNHAEMNLSHKFVPLEFTTLEDIEMVFDAIANKVAPFDSIGGLIIDELSQIASEDLDRVYESRRVHNTSLADTPDWGDYRPALTRIRTKIMNKVQRLGLHSVIIAHERETGEKAGTGMIVADFAPATLVKVSAPLDYIARLTSDDESAPGAQEAVLTWNIQVRGTKRIDAKNGLGINLMKFQSKYFPDAVQKWLDSLAIPAAPALSAPAVSAPATTSVPSSETDDFSNPFDKIED